MKPCALAIVLLILLPACKSHLEAVAPEINIQELPPIKQRESSVYLPIKINLQPYFNDTEKALPTTFNGKEEKCEGVSYAYTFIRNPIAFQGKDDKLYFEVDGKYALHLNYCPECTSLFDQKERCIIPRIYASCGVEENMRRVSVGYQMNLKIDPEFKFKSKTELKKFALTDPCEITVFNYDASSKLKKEVTGVLEDLEKTIDNKMSSINIKSEIEEVWKQLSKPTKMEDYGYFAFQPKALSLSDIQFKHKTAFIDMHLTILPTFTTEKPIPKEVNLPFLTAHKQSKGFDIELDATATYDSLSSIITKAISGQSVKIKKNEIFLQKFEIHGASNEQLFLKLAFKGKKSGVIYLIGTPVFDREKQTVSFPDLVFDLKSKHLLLKSAKWLFSENITTSLRSKAVFDISPYLKPLKERLQNELNTELVKGVFLEGNVDKMELTNLFPTKDSLIIRINVLGSLKLSM